MEQLFPVLFNIYQKDPNHLKTILNVTSGDTFQEIIQQINTDVSDEITQEDYAALGLTNIYLASNTNSLKNLNNWLKQI